MSKPAFLLIDVGNTHVKWATAGPRGPIHSLGRMATGKITPPWIRSLTRKFPEQQAVLASVVPATIPAFRRAFVRRLLIVTGNSPELGLSFDYPKPAELGADRLASAVAAFSKGKAHWPIIVVNCGTATAFTVLDARGRLCGGAIAPGLQAQLDSLLSATAQLPATELAPPRRYLGRSTQEAIRSGVWLNFHGGVKEILHQLSRELPGTRKPLILLTGGNAKLLAKLPGFTIKLESLLVFEGLRIIGTRHFDVS